MISCFISHSASLMWYNSCLCLIRSTSPFLLHLGYPHAGFEGKHRALAGRDLGLGVSGRSTKGAGGKKAFLGSHMGLLNEGLSHCDL